MPCATARESISAVSRLPQPSAVDQGPGNPGERRARSGAGRVPHARQAVLRSPGYPQQPGRGWRQHVRPRLVRHLRLQHDLRRAPSRVVAALETDPAFGIDRLSSALLDYGDSHAAFTVATQSGGDGWVPSSNYRSSAPAAGCGSTSLIRSPPDRLQRGARRQLERRRLCDV